MTAVPAPPPAPAPEQQWRENEDGPECSCGNPTVVKLMPDGSAALLCLFHTSEAALFTSLPAERPAGWPARAATAPAPEAATPDPVAATVAALVELAHNRNGASRIAREGISGRSQERACQLEGEAIGLDAAAALVRERLAPAWDALAARLAAVRAIHQQHVSATYPGQPFQPSYPEPGICVHDHHPWPCPTIKAITSTAPEAPDAG